MIFLHASSRINDPWGRCEVRVQGIQDDDTDEIIPANLGLLFDGLQPRAALGVLVHPTRGPAPLARDVFDRMAEMCIREVKARLCWVPSLSLFLQNRSVPVSATEPERALDRWEHRMNDLILAGCYPHRLWDFATGEEILARDIRSREESYSDAVRSVGDLRLDTRWVDWWRSESRSTALEEMVAKCTIMKENGWNPLQIRADARGILLTYEVTLASQMAILDRIGWREPLVEHLVCTLVERLSPAASKRDLRSHLERLRHERTNGNIVDAVPS